MKFRFTESESFNVRVGSSEGFKTEFDAVISNDKYHGEYEFEPSTEEQTIRTAGYVLSEDIKIRAIPSNYGLITWNGSALTVS